MSTTTIVINTYDPESRFDMDKEEAELFYQHVEQQAAAAGYESRREWSISVDEESERFVEKCFAEYAPE